MSNASKNFGYKEREISRINLERFEDEPMDAYQAFLVYSRLIYADRTVVNTSTITGFEESKIKFWQRNFDWEKRASVLDAEEEILLREDRLRLQKQDNIQFVEKAKEIKEEALELGRDMVKAAKHLLENVKFIDQVVKTGEVETKDGRLVPTTTEIHFKAKVSDIPRLADVGMKITQLASNMPTEIIETKVVNLEDLRNLSDEEIIAQIEAETQTIRKKTGEAKLKLVS